MINLGTVDTFVELSPQAKSEIRKQLSKHIDANAGVRIHVVLDRFSGFVFDLEFDTPGPDDYEVTLDGIHVFTHKTYLDYVKGMRIDYDEEIPAFVFKNEQPSYNCVPGTKYECPSCNLFEERKDDPAYIATK